MDFDQWTKTLHILLDELQAIDLGYPLGTNTVFPPRSSESVEQSLSLLGMLDHVDLKGFYSCCDGISLPDVHIGYFIKPLTQLTTQRQDSEPVELSGPVSGHVLSFGSTGGGGLFVLRHLQRDVLYLSPGPLHGGVYDTARGRATQLASDLASFCDLLLDDVAAFVRGRAHVFLA